MKNYDVIVIGSGCGMLITEEAVGHDRKAAMIDRGPLIGGTCLNWGCIPSKMLIYPADRIVEVRDAGKLGITAEVKDVDFHAIMERMRESRRESQKQLREGISQVEGMDFYEGEASFSAEYKLEVNGEELKGEKIFIASGSRPLVPPIKGLEDVDYLDNESVLELDERPESLIIVGGGYVAVEYAHFFAAMGTRVTILEMVDRLVLSEEPEIAELLKENLSRRMDVHTGAKVEEVKSEGKRVKVTASKKTGERSDYTAERMMMAVGRRSNADLLKVENTGVELDDRGYIKVNEHMETNMKNIYAVGDANGHQMFTHMANREAAIAAHNVLHDAELAVDYSAVPHAVYSYPQIASVGLKEEDARKNHKVLVGKTKYYDTAKGEAMMETEAFAKAIVEEETGKILGFHLIGPYAPVLVQEAVNAMASGGGLDEINGGIHIHPALSEIVPMTFGGIG